MLNFIKIGGTRTGRQYGEMYTSRILFMYFLQEISWEALPKKILNNFKRLMA